MKAVLFAGLTLVVAGWSAPALADLVPPENEAVSACSGLGAGQACVIEGANGTCQSATCTHDYAHLDDAGLPLAGQVACVQCIGPGKHQGCSSSPTSGSMREICALAIAGSFSLLFLLRRRKRAR